MIDQELLKVWKSYDRKLEEMVSINQELVVHLRKTKINDTLSRMWWPKQIILIIGIPYTIFLYLITFIGYLAGGFFVTLGFGMISLIMTGVTVSYVYHLYLIDQIKRSDDIMEVQTQIAQLKLSSFYVARLVVLQLPFWSICWMSWEALKDSPFVYGGINLLIATGLSYLAYYLFQKLSLQDRDHAVNRIFLSGLEWDPILKAANVLDQIKEYQKNE